MVVEGGILSKMEMNMNMNMGMGMGMRIRNRKIRDSAAQSREIFDEESVQEALLYLRSEQTAVVQA
jgi:hypothetical protein